MLGYIPCGFTGKMLHILQKIPAVGNPPYPSSLECPIVP